MEGIIKCVNKVIYFLYTHISMSEVIKEHKCKICKKKYSGYQSLWIHNKKYHSEYSTLTIKQPISNIQNDECTCTYCTKKLSNSYSKWRHMKTCKKKEIYENENNKLKEKLNLLENKIENTIKFFYNKNEEDIEV